MGCQISRPARQTEVRRAIDEDGTEKQWQHVQQVTPPSTNNQASKPFLSPIEPNQSTLNSANGFVSLCAGEHTARPLKAFSFVNGGLLGPSSPPARESTEAGNTTHSSYLGTVAIRAYGCERDLINAYYIYIHPYLPLLPPPAFPQYEDRPTEVVPLSSEADQSILPFWPVSPLGLALSALLVLIPLARESEPLSEAAAAYRRSYTKLYARAAEQALENHIEHRQSKISSYASTYTFHPPSGLHPHTPAMLEPILALLALTVYDYCHGGNRRHMRVRSHQALTAAMDLSLHTLTPEAGDAHKRTWWMTMYLALQSSILNHSVPILLLHDSRITTPYPEFHSRCEPWGVLMEAQNALLRAGTIAKELSRKRNKADLPRATADDIRRLDSTVLALGARLATSGCAMEHEGAEPSAARNLWSIAVLFVHTARIKLHRFIAFGDSPLLLDKHWDIKPGTLSNLGTSTLSPPPHHEWTLDVDSTFPFTTQESTDICLRSALVISRTIRHLPPPNPNYFEGPAAASLVSSELTDRPPPPQPLLGGPQFPRSLPYQACCMIQSCYVLTMILRRLYTCLSSRDLSACHYLVRCAQPGTEIQDVERAIEELRNGIGSLYASLKADSVFEGVVDMARDVEAIYTAYFSRTDMYTAPF